MHTSLAQKYRPKLFSEVLGQDLYITILKKMIKDRSYNQAVMFSGLYGLGKTTLARIYARALLCDDLTEDIEPCNACQSCQAFFAENNPSFREIDAASNGGVSDIRMLREEADYICFNNKKKIILIDECHAISSEGNKALFKQLEESSENQIYLFCTTSPESMAPEIRSRCFEFQLRNATKDDILERLKVICKAESIIYEEGALDKVASFTAPHIRDAIKQLDVLSKLGVIEESNVSEVLFLNNIKILEFLRLIPTDLSKAYRLLDDLVRAIPIKVLYENILDVLLKTIKLNYGVNFFVTNEEHVFGKILLKLYGEKIPKIVDHLLNRVYVSKKSILDSDIYYIHSLFKDFELCDLDNIEEDIKKLLAGKMTQAPESASVDAKAFHEPVKANVSKTEKKPIEKKVVKPIDKTSEVLSKYKMYSQKHALLMDRAKNSLDSEMETVKSSKKVKDFKENLSREEIRRFLDSRGTPFEKEKLGSFRIDSKG